MTVPFEENGRIGVIMHLSTSEYLKISEEWCFELPEERRSTPSGILACGYVGFTVEGQWKAAARISCWKFERGDGGRRIAELSAFSGTIYNLAGVLQRDLPQMFWLTEDQLGAIEADLRVDTRLRPIDIEPSMTMEEACSSVARRYGVDANQVQISIHSKPYASS